MSDDNYGWEYLNFDDEEGSFSSEDGSWGYTNEDGSGSFYGADGSWGYKNDDGSASFYGSDGSWGYRNDDGSVSYYGADGSWGYRNEDGSGSFYNSDSEATYYDSNSDDSDDEESSSDSDSGGSLLGLALGLGAIGLIAAIAGKNKSGNDSDDYEDDSEDTDYDYQQQQEDLRRIAAEQQRREKNQLRKEKNKTFRRKHWKGLVLACIFITALLFGGYKYWEYSKLIPVGISSDLSKNENYEIINEKLKESGFTDIDPTPLYDLDFESRENEGQVDRIIISGKDSFSSETKFPYDTRVVIEYHSIKRETFPLSAKAVKGMQYQEVIQLLDEIGFGNVNLIIDYDLITGWINQEGEIESITIDGNDSFKENNTFPVDVLIEIVYHDYRKNNPGT